MFEENATMSISEKVKRHVDMIKSNNLTRQEFVEIKELYVIDD